MSTSREALANLEKAVAEVVKCAENTLSGVGMANFLTTKEQDDAFRRAREKLAAAQLIAAAVDAFKKDHGDFN